MVVFMVLSLVGVAALSLRLLLWYGNWSKMPWYVFVVALVGWFTGMSTVAVLPIDVVSGRYRRCVMADGEDACEKPWVYMDQNAMYIYWEIVYWTAFCLTWAVAPLLNGYIGSGGFTVPQKLLLSLKDNAIQYSIVGGIGIIAIIVIAVSQNMGFAELQGFLIAMANLYALVLIICFMGYGLVEVPRRLWFRSDHDELLRDLEFKAVTRRENREEAQAAFDKVLGELAAVNRAVTMRDVNRPHVDEIIRLSGVNVAAVPPIGSVSAFDIDMDMLVDLNCKVHRRRLENDRCKHLWRRNLKEAFHLIDIRTCHDSPSRVFLQPWRTAERGRLVRLKQRLRWWWYCRFESISLKLLAVFCGLLSLVIVWSEVTLPVTHPILSIFELISHSNAPSSIVMMVAFVTQVYMSACVYSSLFKLRLFHFFVLVGNHHTSNSSLIFCAGWICRLSFSLCYNFSLLVDAQETGYRLVYNKLEFVPVLGLGFNVYFPVLLVVVVVMVLFNVFGRLMSMCPCTRFLTSFRFDEDMLDDDNHAGQFIIRRARERAEADPSADLDAIDYLPSSGERVPASPPSKSESTAAELFGSKSSNPISSFFSKVTSKFSSNPSRDRSSDHTLLRSEDDSESGLELAPSRTSMSASRSQWRSTTASASSSSGRNATRSIFDDV